MASFLRRFAASDISLTRDMEVEERKRARGDEVSFYRTNFFQGGKEYFGNILIRPHDFTSPDNPDDRAGQRISFELIPKLSTDAQGRSMVRLDNDFALEYDL